MMHDGRLNGKIALITGACKGIGLATAKLFIAEGANVIITDILDDIGPQIARDIGAIFHKLDVKKEEDWLNIKNIAKKEFGKIDILFNNAGIIGLNENLGPQDPEHTSLEDWHLIHAVNLDGVFLGCKYGISLMRDDGGSIINMSSRSGLVGVPDVCAYASSKAAVRNHTKSVALYCANKGYNIRCNSLHPAAIHTELWDKMLGDDETTRSKNKIKVAANIPLGCMGDATDVAYAALYLASDESKFITGIELNIDGGILAGSTSSPTKYNE